MAAKGYRVFVTGGSGVLGRGLIPLLRDAGVDVVAPGRTELDLGDAAAVRRAIEGADVVYHLATRIPPPERAAEPGAWDENNRLREVVSGILVDAALDAGAGVYVQPSVTFVYPAEGAVDESTPVEDAANLRTMLVAEAQAQRFGDAGRRGIVLRLGLLWGPGAASDAPNQRYGATLQIDDAATALLAALELPSGVYNVVSDGQRVSNARFKTATGWSPRY